MANLLQIGTKFCMIWCGFAAVETSEPYEHTQKVHTGQICADNPFANVTPNSHGNPRENGHQIGLIFGQMFHSRFQKLI